MKPAMTLKTTALALILSMGPATVFAMGCAGQEHQTQSCAAGTVWDAEQQACITQITS